VSAGGPLRTVGSLGAPRNGLGLALAPADGTFLIEPRGSRGTAGDALAPAGMSVAGVAAAERKAVWFRYGRGISGSQVAGCWENSVWASQ
jgi:hypothetical protein